MQGVPLFFGSRIAEDAFRLFRGFTSFMNARVRRQAVVEEVFAFKHVRPIRGVRDLDGVGPCVVLASPGLLESGMSR